MAFRLVSCITIVFLILEGPFICDCQKCCNGPPVPDNNNNNNEQSNDGSHDIIFLIDLSKSVQNKIGQMKDSVTNFVEAADVDKNDIRIGIITFFDDFTVIFPLNKGRTEQVIKDEISTISYQPPKSGKEKTFLKPALAEARNNQFEPSKGGRKNANKIIIVLFDGAIRDDEDAIKEAEKARKDGIKIFSIGVKVKDKNTEDKETVKAISSMPQKLNENYFFSLNFDELINDGILKNVITEVLCVPCNGESSVLKKAREAKLWIARYYEIDPGPIEKLTENFDDIRFTPMQLDYLISLYKALVEHRKNPNSRKKRKAINFDVKKSELKDVPEKFKDNFPATHRDTPFYVTYQKTDEKENKIKSKVVRNVVEELNENTCLKLIASTEKDGQLELKFHDQSTCSSWVGKPLNIEDMEDIIQIHFETCRPLKGRLLHELLHSLGLFHEMNRPGRSEVLKVNLKGMKEDSQLNVFELHQNLVKTYDLPYDLTSILQYRTTSFSKEKNTRVIFPVDKRMLKSLGQRAQMSFYDRKAIHKIYCSPAKNCKKKCNRGGYIRHDICECYCPDGLGGPSCESVAESDTSCGTTNKKSKVEKQEKCITSPNYPKAYKDKTSCNWWLQADKGKHIKMYFVDSSVDVHCETEEGAEICYHWVEIKHSGTFESPGIRYCCEKDASALEEVVSENNEAVVTFRSIYETKGGDNRGGFKLCFVAVDQGPKKINFCDSSPCVNGECIMKVDTYTCVCKEGFTGDLCESVHTKTEPKEKVTKKPGGKKCHKPLVPNTHNLCSNPTCNNPKPKRNCENASERPDCVCPTGKIYYPDDNTCIGQRMCECKDDKNKSRKKNESWMSDDCKTKSTCLKLGQVKSQTVKCRKCNKNRCFDEKCEDKKPSVYFDSKKKAALSFRIDGLSRNEKKTDVLFGSGKFITFESSYLIELAEVQKRSLTIQYLQFTVFGASSVVVWLSVLTSEKEKYTINLNSFKQRTLSWTVGEELPEGGLKNVDFIEIKFVPSEVVKVSNLLIQVCIQE